MDHAIFCSVYGSLHDIAFAPFVLISIYTTEIQVEIKKIYSYNVH